MINTPQRRLSARNFAGLSLVELLVATLITLIGLLVITQVFAVYEGWKRVTTGVAQTQEAGLLGAFAIEQDLRHAGFGMIGLECAKISAYNAKSIEFQGSPVKICPNEVNPAGCPSDENKYVLSVIYSSSPYANVKSSLQRPMPKAAEELYIDNGMSFGLLPKPDMLLISEGAACSILQASGEPVESLVPNVTSSGNAWKLPHDRDAIKSPWNPPEGTDIFPAGGFNEGARVFNLGQLVEHRFYVNDYTLIMEERSAVDGSISTYDLAHGVMGLRAQCLPDGCDKQPTAIRFGLIVRSDSREKEVIKQAEVEVSTGGGASIAFWPGKDAPTFDLGSQEEALHYRYRVFQTVVPLKNVVWNPAP